MRGGTRHKDHRPPPVLPGGGTGVGKQETACFLHVWLGLRRPLGRACRLFLHPRVDGWGPKRAAGAPWGLGARGDRSELQGGTRRLGGGPVGPGLPAAEPAVPWGRGLRPEGLKSSSWRQ